MIISASRRTDIPACYADWFFQRIKESFVLVRNPMNPKQVSKIPLAPNQIDGFVFWTKNPLPMIGRLHLLKGYQYYFQFTLNAYGNDMETNLPKKSTELLPAFQKLSDLLGPDRVLWRYDPILLNETYTAAYHIKYFEKLAACLQGYTRVCTISFLDFYRNIQDTVKAHHIQPVSLETKQYLAKELSQIGKCYGLEMRACAEDIDLKDFGILPSSCIDKKRFELLSGYSFHGKKDTAQRPACGCMESIDIGAYHTCKNGCQYCYANHSRELVQKHIRSYDPLSPMLCSELLATDVVKKRAVKSCKEQQLKLI